MTFISFTPTTHKTDTISSFLAYDPYIERFWQPILGPTATGLLNLLSLEALNSNIFTTTYAELSRRTGTGYRQGSASPAAKQLKRLHSFGLIRQRSENQYEISPQIPALSSRYLSSLHSKEKIHHEIWIDRLIANPLNTQINKASHLASCMIMMGYQKENINYALANSGLHPSIVGQIQIPETFALAQ